MILTLGSPSSLISERHLALPGGGRPGAVVASSFRGFLGLLVGGSSPSESARGLVLGF